MGPAQQHCRKWAFNPIHATDWETIVEPLGVAVLIEGKHMCAMARGVRDMHSVMKVNVMHGVFQKDPNIRAELLMRLGLK